jgi:mannose-6-phosphate isomerase-like protein (cupin superfamily)
MIDLGDHEQTRELHEFQHIPVGQWHRLYNPFDEPCRVVEIQYGEACDEDDIERRK